LRQGRLTNGSGGEQSEAQRKKARAAESVRGLNLAGSSLETFTPYPVMISD
jgi:hypothetical protein